MKLIHSHLVLYREDADGFFCDECGSPGETAELEGMVLCPRCHPDSGLAVYAEADNVLLSCSKCLLAVVNFAVVLNGQDFSLSEHDAMYCNGRLHLRRRFDGQTIELPVRSRRTEAMEAR